MNDDFNYIVTPLCYDAKVRVECEDVLVEKVFGSNIESTDELVKIDTACAGAVDDRGVKGGLIVIRSTPKTTERFKCHIGETTKPTEEWLEKFQHLKEWMDRKSSCWR